MQTSLLLIFRQIFLLFLASAKSTRSILAPASLKSAATRAQSSSTKALVFLITLFLSYLPLRKMPRTSTEPLSFRDEQEELKMEAMDGDADEAEQSWRKSKNVPEVREAKAGSGEIMKEKEWVGDSVTAEPEPEQFDERLDRLDFDLSTGPEGDVTLEYEKGPSPQRDIQFYSSLENEWNEEASKAQEPESLVSRIFWMPALLFLRGVSFGLGLAFGPMFFALRNLFGINTENTNFWDVPLERRKQTAVTFFLLMFYPLCGVCAVLTLITLFIPGLNFLVVVYLLWIFKWDDSAWSGRRRPFMRYWKIWRHFVNYFPIRLIKTHNLDPRGKYIFCYHPHGIIPVGALGNFAMDATGFSRKFPGINIRFLTLSVNFIFPVMRELFLSLGLCSVSKKSCLAILNRGPGSAIGIAVGGAEEALNSKPGTYRVLMREGCIRIALETGASLVPVLGFGETDVYQSYVYEEGSRVRSFQDFFKRVAGFSFPLFHGRGLFNYSLGVMPHRTPVYTVVGKPIKVPKAPPHLRGSKLSSTPEGRALVAKYREEYIDALTEMYNHFKNKWAVDRAESLQISLRQSTPRRKVQGQKDKKQR